MADAIHRTLVIRLSSVGDIILSSLLLRTLHQRFPECRIDYLVKTAYSELVRFNPHVSSVIEFPDGGGWSELHRLRRTIHATGYDLVLDIHDSIRSRYLCFGLPHVERIRKRKLARFLLVRTKWDVYEFFHGAPSVAERYLETVEDYGVSNDELGLEVVVPADAQSRGEAILGEGGIRKGSVILGICPGARHKTKMWLPERYAETACRLAGDKNVAVLLFGHGDEEKELCETIKAGIARINPGTCVVNVAGRLSLMETAALMDHCSVILTNDTGLMHLAAARKRKVVAIFGPTVRELGFFPYGTTSTVIEDISLPCRPCTHVGSSRCPKGHFKCMKNIAVDQVVETTRHLLTTAHAT
jgi:heptosyltransferase-2